MLKIRLVGQSAKTSKFYQALSGKRLNIHANRWTEVYHVNSLVLLSLDFGAFKHFYRD